MMRAVEFKKWHFLADTEATRAAYRSVPTGSPEECGCLYCRNFAAARSQIYPPEALALLEQIGVPPNREAETWEGGPVGAGRYFYAGWFHLVGEALIGRDAVIKISEASGTWELEELTKEFSLGLTTKLALVPAAFKDYSLLQLEFQASVPWVLEEPYPE